MAETIQTKRCSKCKQTKSISEFYRRPERKNGYRSNCKHCETERHKKYVQSHRTKMRKYEREYYQNHQHQMRERKNRNAEKHRVKHRQYHRQRRNTIRGHLMDIWHQMLRRCNNPKSSGWKYYGARGIQNKFPDFETFYNYIVKELKVDPRGLTIDRINNDGHYEIGNIRFVSHRENCQNRDRKYQKITGLS